jgi:hypothetical protein
MFAEDIALVRDIVKEEIANSSAIKTEKQVPVDVDIDKIVKLVLDKIAIQSDKVNVQSADITPKRGKEKTNV